MERKCSLSPPRSLLLVSIPFKREGTWKETSASLLPKKQYEASFNSLQTGRYMERWKDVLLESLKDGFNSLQTGRYMES